MNNCSKELSQIVDSISEAGYDPYMQILGYLRTNDDAYITRTGNARNTIKLIDRSVLEEYVNNIFSSSQK